jgi:nucleoid-associated protein YgaU
MIGSKLIAMLVAILAVVGIAAGGVYVYRQSHVASTTTQDEVAADQSPTPAPEPSKPQSQANSEAVVPSFDVVRIEPSGDGVLAGRAEPGWSVSIEDRGAAVGETTADEEGAWSIMLEKPLPAGDHSLSVKSVSPDRARSLISQQAVPVAVGKGQEAVATRDEADEPTQPQTESAAPGEAAAPTVPPEAQAETSSEPEPASPGPTAEEAATPEPVSPSEPEEDGRRKQPPVKFKTVDYEDRGNQAGKITLSGTGDPGARITLFIDDAPFGEATIGGDGTWRFEKEAMFPNGEHKFRADLIDEASGVVVGRASISVRRTEPAPEAKAEPAAPEPMPQAASPQGNSAPAAAPQVTPPQAATPQVAAPQVDAAETVGPGVSKPVTHGKKHRPRVYTIQRGDTLWEIAERYFGGGWHYVTIYHDNRKQIANPHRIYPQQKLNIPKQ